MGLAFPKELLALQKSIGWWATGIWFEQFLSQGWNFPMNHLAVIFLINPVNYYDKHSITKPSCLQGSIKLGNTCWKQQKITGFSMLCKWSLTWAHQSVLLQRLHALAGLWPNRSDALSAMCLYSTVIPQILTGEGKALNSKSCASMTITCWIIASRNYLVKWEKHNEWFKDPSGSNSPIGVVIWIFRPDCSNLGKVSSELLQGYEITLLDSWGETGWKWNAD